MEEYNTDATQVQPLALIVKKERQMVHPEHKKSTDLRESDRSPTANSVIDVRAKLSSTVESLEKPNSTLDLTCDWQESKSSVDKCKDEIEHNIATVDACEGDKETYVMDMSKTESSQEECNSQPAMEVKRESLSSLTENFDVVFKYCIAYNCHERCSESSTSRFYRFPKSGDDYMSNKWAKKTRLKSLQSKSSHERFDSYILCEKHFENNMFEDTGYALKVGAVPSIFDFTKKEVKHRSREPSESIKRESFDTCASKQKTKLYQCGWCEKNFISTPYLYYHWAFGSCKVKKLRSFIPSAILNSAIDAIIKDLGGDKDKDVNVRRPKIETEGEGSPEPVEGKDMDIIVAKLCTKCSLHFYCLLNEPGLDFICDNCIFRETSTNNDDSFSDGSSSESSSDSDRWNGEDAQPKAKHAEDAPLKLKHTCKWVSCGDKFATKKQRKLHHKIMHIAELNSNPVTNDSYACRYDECHRNFNCRAALVQHASRHGFITKQYRCVESGCAMIYRNLKEMKVHVTDKHPLVNMCPIFNCSRFYMSNEMVEAHVKQDHAKSAQHSCLVCKTVFFSTRSYRTHCGEHSDIMLCPFVFCAAAFLSKAELKSHLASKHDKVYELVCPKEDCSYMTAYPANFRKHIVKHDNQYELCLMSTCSGAFLTVEDLDNHLASFHGYQKAIRCPGCKMDLTNSVTWSRHIRNNHPELHVCSRHNCIFATEKKEVLESHYDVEHGALGTFQQ